MNADTSGSDENTVGINPIESAQSSPATVLCWLPPPHETHNPLSVGHGEEMSSQAVLAPRTSRYISSSVRRRWQLFEGDVALWIEQPVHSRTNDKTRRDYLISTITFIGFVSFLMILVRLYSNTGIYSSRAGLPIFASDATWDLFQNVLTYNALGSKRTGSASSHGVNAWLTATFNAVNDRQIDQFSSILTTYIDDTIPVFYDETSCVLITSTLSSTVSTPCMSLWPGSAQIVSGAELGLPECAPACSTPWVKVINFHSLSADRGDGVFSSQLYSAIAMGPSAIIIVNDGGHSSGVNQHSIVALDASISEQFPELPMPIVVVAPVFAEWLQQSNLVLDLLRTTGSKETHVAYQLPYAELKFDGRDTFDRTYSQTQTTEDVLHNYCEQDNSRRHVVVSAPISSWFTAGTGNGAAVAIMIALVRQIAKDGELEDPLSGHSSTILNAPHLSCFRFHFIGISGHEFLDEAGRNIGMERAINYLQQRNIDQNNVALWIALGQGIATQMGFGVYAFGGYGTHGNSPGTYSFLNAAARDRSATAFEEPSLSTNDTLLSESLGFIAPGYAENAELTLYTMNSSNQLGFEQQLTTGTPHVLEGHPVSHIQTRQVHLYWIVVFLSMHFD